MNVFQVKDWNDHFENNKSRERDHCSFVVMPNKQHGMGFTRVISQPDGAMLVGIWTMIVQACSRQKKPRDGWLTDDGHPTGRAWTPDDMAVMWRRPVAEIVRAVEVFSSPQIGWLQVHTEVPARCPSGAPEEEENRKEKNSPSGGAATAPRCDAESDEGATPKNELRVIWDLGVNVLRAGGMANKEARSLLGSLAQDYGKTALAQAIAMTSAANPASPKEYLVKLLQKPDGATPNGRELTGRAAVEAVRNSRNAG
ncbi:MAG: hypothetical protein ACJ741_11115 [Pyrinomonadaceae bacterium]